MLSAIEKAKIDHLAHIEHMFDAKVSISGSFRSRAGIAKSQLNLNGSIDDIVNYQEEVLIETIKMSINKEKNQGNRG